MIQKHIDIISSTLGVMAFQIKNTLELFDDGATIPFIARYRKERTGSLDEVQVGEIQKQYKKLIELEARKLSILASIEEQGKLTELLRKKIESSYDALEIEDLYLPFKKKKKTKGDIAKEKGLEPLAKIILSQQTEDVSQAARRYLNAEVENVAEAIKGAKDIIAEWINENQELREKIRQNFRKFAFLQSRLIPKKKEEAEKYTDYFDFKESLSRCPSHRFLAVNRGHDEGFLKMGLLVDEDRIMDMVEKKYVRSNGEVSKLIKEAIADSYQRLMFPSLETQILHEYKDKADDEAIKVFGENLRQLLLSAPLGQKAVLAIDPGFRTGCKVVCLDSYGDFIKSETIFPHPPQNEVQKSKDQLRHLVHAYNIKAIAIGNGTASRETMSLVETIPFDSHVDIYTVSESGASIYSASEVARTEFPDLDITIRGAISIGRRLMDPLAELVKIDAKSIGVGQYQHDVHQGKLKENLDNTVVSCVNIVGVNINTASKHILHYIAGLGPVLANNIVAYRRANGDFNSIFELTKVPRLGNKAFEQAAGFLRIRDGLHVLDNTGVHPESYVIVEAMAKSCGLSLEAFVQEKERRKTLKLEDFITDQVGLPTLKDIMKELDKPGLDPRGEATVFSFDPNIKSISDLYEGMIVPGIVTNLTNFGSFVDIGVKQDGLLHISQITKKFIQNPADVLHLGQILQVKIIGVDASRNRINLTLLF